MAGRAGIGIRRMTGMEENKKTFRKELEGLINRHSMERGRNTPDYILAAFLEVSLAAFDQAVRLRSEHYGTQKVEQGVTNLIAMAGIRSSQEKKDVPAPSGEAIERAKTTAAHVRFDGPDGPEFYLCTRCGYNGLSPASHFCLNCGREINWGGACADSPAGENLS